MNKNNNMNEVNNMMNKKAVIKNEPGFRVLADGISVSNDTRVTGLNNNDIVIGSSGAGKTGGYVIPNIQNITGSLIVSDTKGQLYRRFSRELKNKGYKVSVLDFVNPENSCVYNPLAHIRRYKDGAVREQDILTIAHSLVPDILDQHDKFWVQAARSYLAFLVGYVLEALPKNEQNLVTVSEIHHLYNSPNGSLAFLDWIAKNPDSFAAKKYIEMQSSQNADKMWSSILAFANIALEPFGFREAAHIFGKGKSLDLRKLGSEKTILFLNVSDTDRSFDHTINVLYTQALQVLCAEADINADGRLNVPVRIIIDDFAASAKIENFDKIISVIRSREISVSLILQSMTQLSNMYGNAAETIVDNCDHMLYLGTPNQETARFIGTRAKKTPEKILVMPNDMAYLLAKGEEARLVKKVPPYSTVM